VMLFEKWRTVLVQQIKRVSSLPRCGIKNIPYVGPEGT
jgi:hypothetical protein